MSVFLLLAVLLLTIFGSGDLELLGLLPLLIPFI